MRIAVAQIGARRHYAVPAIFEHTGLLELLYTDLTADALPLRFLNCVVPEVIRPNGLRRLLGRHAAGVPRNKLRCFPRFALRRVSQRRKATTPCQLTHSFLNDNIEFCRLVTRRGMGNANTIYAFNGAALEIFEWARQSGIRTIVDQTIAPVAVEESLMAEERRRWPSWEFDGTQRKDWRPLAEREAAEWELADVVLCGSEFVRNGIASKSGPVERCQVVPFGAAPGLFQTPENGEPHQELRVLFVGSICLRKGIQYLAQAAKQLRSSGCVFRVVGPIRVSEQATAELRGALNLIGPVPRSQIVKHYQWADVLVLPSLAEGSANVCYEALACGVPVVTTPNAGSVVRDGIDGYIVDIRDVEAIETCLRQLAEDRSLLAHLSANARDRAKEYTWERYSERLLAAIGCVA